MFGSINYLDLDKAKQFITEKSTYDNIFIFSKFIVNENKNILLKNKKLKNKFLVFIVEERNSLDKKDIGNIWAQLWNFFISCKAIERNYQIKDSYKINNINLFKYLSKNYQNSLAFLFIRCIAISEKLKIDETVKDIIFNELSDSKNAKKILIEKFHEKYTNAKENNYIMNSLRPLISVLSYGLKGKFSITRIGNRNNKNQIINLSYYKDNARTENKNLKNNDYIAKIKYDDFLIESIYIINNINNNDFLKESILFDIFCKTNAENKNFVSLNFNLDSNIITIKEEEKKIKEDKKLTVTEKENLIKSRIGQGIFRKKILNDFKKCIFTDIDNELLLIASHIKPWKISTNEERLDVNNGLLLTPTYDKLFDLGLISFDKNKLLISNKIADKKLLTTLNIKPNMKINFKLNKEREQFLKFHRENIFKK